MNLPAVGDYIAVTHPINIRGDLGVTNMVVTHVTPTGAAHLGYSAVSPGDLSAMAMTENPWEMIAAAGTPEAATALAQAIELARARDSARALTRLEEVRDLTTVRHPAPSRLYVAVIEWNGEDSEDPEVIIARSPERRERGELAEILDTLDRMSAGFYPNLTSDVCALAWQEMGYPKIEDVEAAGLVSETLAALLEADGPFVTYTEIEESEILP